MSLTLVWFSLVALGTRSTVWHRRALTWKARAENAEQRLHEVEHELVATILGQTRSIVSYELESGQTYYMDIDALPVAKESR